MDIKLGMAIAGWTILAVAYQQGQQQAAQQPQRGRLGFKAPPLTPDQRIASIQSGIQLALEDLSMTKLVTRKGIDANGKPVTIKQVPTFGMRRSPTYDVVHDGVIRDSNVVMFMGTNDYRVEILAVSSKGKPLGSGKLILQAQDGNLPLELSEAQTKPYLALARKAMPTLAKKDLFRSELNGDEVQLRPLRLSKPECLPCHAESKIGDPLALMLYTVKRKKG